MFETLHLYIFDPLEVDNNLADILSCCIDLPYRDFISIEMFQTLIGLAGAQ